MKKIIIHFVCSAFFPCCGCLVLCVSVCVYTDENICVYVSIPDSFSFFEILATPPTGKTLAVVCVFCLSCIRTCEYLLVRDQVLEK